MSSINITFEFRSIKVVNVLIRSNDNNLVADIAFVPTNNGSDQDIDCTETDIVSPQDNVHPSSSDLDDTLEQFFGSELQNDVYGLDANLFDESTLGEFTTTDNEMFDDLVTDMFSNYILDDSVNDEFIDFLAREYSEY